MSHPLAVIFQALAFSAERHRHQRRKDRDASPYINHPIQVAEELLSCGLTDTTTILAAILHDTLEDTRTEAREIADIFGEDVLAVVREVTDDTSLPRAERRHLQVAGAPGRSTAARLLRIADKTCNVRDLAHSPPADWSPERKREYLDWTAKVVDACRGTNAELEGRYNEAAAECRRLFAPQPPGGRRR